MLTGLATLSFFFDDDFEAVGTEVEDEGVGSAAGALYRRLREGAEGDALASAMGGVDGLTRRASMERRRWRRQVGQSIVGV
jgi:hypothetical protein